MRTLIISLVVLAVLAGAGAAAYKPAMDYWEHANAPKWKTAEVIKGDIISVVNATGTIKPKLQIAVGSFVSGPIDPDFPIADFNQEVKKGQLLAKIQETIYKANVLRDEANLQSKEAEVKRFEALHQQAVNDHNRALALRQENEGFISNAEMDKFRFGRDSLLAQVELAKAAAKTADAQLDFSKAQLGYTNIVAPEDGVIINRKIDPGQTVAAQFQTPELFVLAPDMRKEMYVHASVDEADIGLITEAHRKSLPVEFTVDAYPDDLFVGKVQEIRLSSTTTQNVVTYPVVVSASNSDLKLLPGMTASISFEVDRRQEVLKIPNSALRFFPRPEHVREADKPLLEGKESDDPKNQPLDMGRSAEERNRSGRNRNRRHVWLQDGIKLRAVEVRTGLSDSVHTELISGELNTGDKLVTGIQP